MRIKNLLKIFCTSSIFATATVSCSDWLQVDLEDSILESSLFSTNEGFTSTLNGAYSSMNYTYGSSLSMTSIDVMAKLYNVGTTHQFDSYYNAAFDESGANFSNIWQRHYKQIAELNALLEYCDSEDSALSSHYYPYIKGEALALRAMLHFDLLRLYGPIYSEETAGTICMPYQETTSKAIQPLLSASDIIEKVIRDLKTASDLLKDDRIRTEGVMNGESDDPNDNLDFRYRQFRLNYYAIQGLLARAHLWKGDKVAAYNYAKDVITENKEKQIFPWTPKTAVLGSNPDLLFSTEVMFALYNLSRVNLYKSYFDISTSASSLLSFAGSTTAEGDLTSKINWFYTDIDDLRRTEMWSLESSEGVENILCFNKYKDISTSETRRYMIPLLRISEIYLIAAECTDNLEEAIEYINEIRTNRNCVNHEFSESISKEIIQEYIDAEFARETIGEGQIYFYYKRLAKTSVLGGLTTDYTYADWYGAEVEMPLQNYVWPMPDEEDDYRENL